MMRFTESDEGRFIVSGQMNLERVNDIINTDLENARMTTIGGLVFQELDRLPVDGDEVDLPGVHVKVLRMQGHRIDRVEITPGAVLITDADDYVDTDDEAAQ